MNSDTLVVVLLVLANTITATSVIRLAWRVQGLEEDR